VLAVVALSARVLAEWAQADGAPVIALDAFGDIDTRRAAADWRRVGHGLRIDGKRLLGALTVLAQRGDVEGWVAGSGFEGDLDLLAVADRLLPRFGTPVAGLRQLAEPERFFALLDRDAIAHPPVRWDDGHAGAGWLRKRGGGSGGLQVWRGGRRQAGEVLQAERAGTAASLTFVANGAEVAVLGFNRLLHEPSGDRPYVYAGVVGPVPVDSAVAADMTHAVRSIVPRCGVRGLGSLDFIVGADGRAEVLELNARPPASALLYRRIDGASPLRAHVRACAHGVLPSAPPPPGVVRGMRVVYARRTLDIDEGAAAAIAAFDDAHDWPQPRTRVAAGEPLCTVGAEGADAEAVIDRLETRRDRLLRLLEEP
jgi:uncharacterized protein